MEQFSALLVVLVMTMVVAANWLDSRRAQPTGPPPTTRLLFWTLLAAVPAGIAIQALRFASAAPAARPAGAGRRLELAAVILLLTAMAAGAMLIGPARARLAGLLPIDPGSAVHATALVLSTTVVGVEVANQAAADVLSTQAQSGPALGPADVVLMELPLLLLAMLGVGLLVRRGPVETLARLGLVRPQAWQILLALAAAGAFFAFGVGMDALGHLLTPGLAREVQAANQRLFGGLSNATGIITIALAAGIAEEILFRGALQPRLGLVWPAIVFTSVHTQYGLSVDALAVLALALGLGVLRKVANTSTTIICHVAYNLVVGLTAAGLSAVWLGPALGVEGLLLLSTLVAVLTTRVPIRRLGT